MSEGRTAYHDAIILLGRRAYSEAELRQRLEKKDHRGPTIDEAIGRLKKAGYLDDVTLARRIVESDAELRSEGRLKVRARLLQRGIPSDVIERELAAGFPEEEEPRACARAVDHFLRLARLPQALEDLNGPERRDEVGKSLRRLASFLERRGFPAGLIARELTKTASLLRGDGETQDAWDEDEDTGRRRHSPTRNTGRGPWGGPEGSEGRP